MNNKVFDIFNINKKKGKKNNEYVVPILKDTSVVENVPTTKEPEEPVLIQKDQLNSTNDLGDIHTEPYRPILQVSYFSLLNNLTFFIYPLFILIFFFVILAYH